MHPLDAPAIVLLVGAMAVAWVVYFRWKDRGRPEPLGLLAVAFGGGGVAIGLALLEYVGLDRLGIDTEWDVLASAPALPAIAAALRIGLVEEGAKFLPVLLLAIFARSFDELLDGIVYAACAALGFSAVESAMYALRGDLSGWIAVGRSLAAPITHALLSAPWGLGLAYTMLARRWFALPLGLAASIAAHGAYDLLLARADLPRIYAPLVILALWLWVLFVAPRLARQAPFPRIAAPSPNRTHPS